MESVIFQSLHNQSYRLRESLRALRTNIQFCGDDVKTILFTSAAPNEGKSTVVMELARSFASSGKMVLLIDTDMRKSVLVPRLKAVKPDRDELLGLSHYLSGQSQLDKVLYASSVKNLFTVFAGRSVPNPTELLEKDYFQELLHFGRENFDYVLIDCAPIGAAIDAAVVANQCDGAVIIIGQGVENSRSINGVKRQLEAAGVRILGAILNKVKSDKTRRYGSYYGKYYGNYVESGESQE